MVLWYLLQTDYCFAPGQRKTRNPFFNMRKIRTSVLSRDGLRTIVSMKALMLLKMSYPEPNATQYAKRKSVRRSARWSSFFTDTLIWPAATMNASSVIGSANLSGATDTCRRRRPNSSDALLKTSVWQQSGADTTKEIINPKGFRKSLDLPIIIPVARSPFRWWMKQEHVSPIALQRNSGFGKIFNKCDSKSLKT